MNQVTSFFALLLVFVSLNVQADYSQRKDVQQFIDEMVEKHGFNRNDLELQFAMAQKLDGVLEAIARPAEKVLTWREYRPIFVTSKRIRKGNDFLEQHHDTLKRAEKEFGVPAEIITAIIGVETYYGRLSGNT